MSSLARLNRLRRKKFPGCHFYENRAGVKYDNIQNSVFEVVAFTHNAVVFPNNVRVQCCACESYTKAGEPPQKSEVFEVDLSAIVDTNHCS